MRAVTEAEAVGGASGACSGGGADLRLLVTKRADLVAEQIDLPGILHLGEDKLCLLDFRALVLKVRLGESVDLASHLHEIGPAGGRRRHRIRIDITSGARKHARTFGGPLSNLGLFDERSRDLSDAVGAGWGSQGPLGERSLGHLRRRDGSRMELDRLVDSHTIRRPGFDRAARGGRVAVESGNRSGGCDATVIVRPLGRPRRRGRGRGRAADNWEARPVDDGDSRLGRQLQKRECRNRQDAEADADQQDTKGDVKGAAANHGILPLRIG